jgi:uncharacterized protein (UPF0335 family)
MCLCEYSDKFAQSAAPMKRTVRNLISRIEFLNKFRDKWTDQIVKIADRNFELGFDGINIAEIILSA